MEVVHLLSRMNQAYTVHTVETQGMAATMGIRMSGYSSCTEYTCRTPDEVCTFLIFFVRPIGTYVLTDLWLESANSLSGTLPGNSERQHKMLMSHTLKRFRLQQAVVVRTIYVWGYGGVFSPACLACQACQVCLKLVCFTVVSN